jgi:hypothetical protein
MSTERDDLLEGLAALTVHDLPPARTARIGAACRRRLARRRPRAWRAATRRLVPVAVGLLAAGYLSWAVERALVLIGVIARA